MRLPEIQLDDRRFQDLVSEARLKITRSCPEWTEHNVSDPGITLIELFAWMTEMTIYRLNRVPDKLHVSLLELLGIRLDGPSAAQTSLRFRLPEVATEPVTIPARRPRSARRGRRPRSRSSSRSTRTSTIPAAVPAAYVLQRGGQVKSIGARRRRRQARRRRPARVREPARRRRRALPRLRGAARPPADRGRRRRLAGARRGREPRGPAAALGGLPGRRRVARGRGARGPHRRLQLRLRHGRRSSCRRARRSSRWPATACTGCAAGSTTRPATAAPRRPTPSRRRSTRSPPASIGARLPATHASQITAEIARRLRRHAGPGLPAAQRARCSSPQAGETLEVQDPESGDWARWELRDDFVGSTEFDRHFTLDLVSGEVEFGPAIRETDGGWTQYGAVPPKGAVLRFTRYRHGGGRTRQRHRRHAVRCSRARSPASTRSPTPTPAVGGVDAEQLEHARERASMEIRSRYRAVTAEDFEFMAGEASPRVARAVCIPPREGGAGAAAHRPARVPGRPPARATTSWSPTRR